MGAESVYGNTATEGSISDLGLALVCYDHLECAVEDGRAEGPSEVEALW